MAPGGTIANVGVHGAKVDLHLERLWAQNITITTRLVDTVTTPMLLKTVQSGKIDPKRLITHRFKLASILDAYDTFGRAAEHQGAQGHHRSLTAAHLPSPRREGTVFQILGSAPAGSPGMGGFSTTRGPFQILTAGISW